MLAWRWYGVTGAIAAALCAGLGCADDDDGGSAGSAAPPAEPGPGMVPMAFDAGGQDAGTSGSTMPPHAMEAGTADAGMIDAGPPPTTSMDDFDGGPISVGSICRRSGSHRVGALDMLFVVDDSGSMEQEQAALSAQFPRLVQTLSTGVGSATDIHLGVVSTDMGIVGINDIEHCTGLGDDGILQHAALPTATSCMTSYPSFLSYRPGQNTAAAFAQDFSCVATLGTNGCGFEQQLESGLKALWPSSDRRVLFLGDVNGAGMLGHGDTENAGFLRSEPPDGPSVLAVIVVTDEEDCSSKTTTHFTPSAYLDPNDPAHAALIGQGLNVRCHANPQNLYEPSRYINGLRALRPGNEEIVVFAAIVGVPPETVNTAVLSRTDFEDPLDRAAFYNGIMTHPLMQPTIDDFGTPDPADDTLKPSCDTAQGKAYPPNRIVQVAQGFGRNGMVQSICEENFANGIDAILTLIGRRLADGGCS